MNLMTAERIGRNDSAFRDANEQIRGKVRDKHIADDRLIPFICECADEACTSIIQLNLAEYDDVRTDSRQFLNVIGHERAEGPIEVMSKTHDHLVVRKAGRAGDIAESLDTRHDGDREGWTGDRRRASDTRPGYVRR